MRLILITGGARAGKSRYAQQRAEELGGGDVTYVATARVCDEEMRARVERHRADRPGAWRTLEVPAQVGSAIAAATTPVVLLDCLTMLAANALERARPADAAAALAAVAAEIDDLKRGLSQRDGVLMVVTNEVGLAVHPPTALGRWFQDALGIANQRLAAVADEVVLMVSGQPLLLKGTWHRRRPSHATASDATLTPAASSARAAMALLTRIPVGAASLGPAAWSWAPAWFPVVGTGIGAASAAVWWVASPLGTVPAAVLALLASVLITGALHEDGLADTADALGGAYSREAIFTILKDSRVGTYGAVALVLSILGRVVLVASLGPAAIGGLVLAHTLSRVGPVWLLIALPYVTPPEVAKSRAVARPGWSRAALATLGALAVTVILFTLDLLTAMAVVTATATVGVSVAALGWYFQRRAGGVTGDFLGAAEQVGEAVVLVALAAALPA